MYLWYWASSIIIYTTIGDACVCVCVCVFATLDQFLPVRSHFDTKRPVNFFHIATFPSPTFGPLFAFHCPFFTKNNNLHATMFWKVTVTTRVLHGPGLGPRAGPARSPWAGPGQDSMIFCGPGRVRAWNLQARAGPGLVSNNFAGCGPGLGLTFPGLGRAGPTMKVTLVLT